MSQNAKHSGLKALKQLMNQAGISLRSFLVPTMLAGAAALFESASFGLLIPLAQGVLQKDFHFVEKTKIISQAFRFIFSAQPLSNSCIFITLVSFIFITAVLKNIFSYISLLTVERQIARFGNQLRKMVFQRYLNTGKMFFDQNNFGHLNQVLLGFTNELMSRLQYVNYMIFSTFVLAGYVGVMIFISWKLMALSLVVFPAMYFSLQWIIQKIEKTSRFEAETKMELQKKITNILFCIPLVKGYSREKEESRQFGDISGRMEWLQFSIGKKTNLIGPFQDIFALAASLCLIALMAVLVSKGEAQHLAGFLVFFVLIRRAMMAFSSLNTAQAQLAAIKGSVQGIQDVMSASEQYVFISGNRHFEGLKSEININNLSFSYGEQHPVLKELNFSIPKGKVTALVGATGSGKTTLVHLFMRFYDCPPGSIKIDGTDIREFELKALRKHIAFVSQEVQLLNDTLKENIIYGIDRPVTDEELDVVLKKARLHEFVQHLPEGVGTLIGDRGVLLSGGEKQRVAIARAILKGAEILILDEATSALDSITEKLVQSAIDDAMVGKTAIVIAHRLSTIQNSDRLLVINKGELIEQGSPQDLLKHQGEFYRYWQQQANF